MKISKIETPLAKFVIGKRSLSASELLCQFFLTISSFLSCLLEFSSNLLICIH